MAAMVVAAAGEGLEPGGGADRPQAVALRQVLDQTAGQRAEEELHQVVGAAVVDAVEGLEAVEEDQQLLELVQGQHVVDPVERVGDRMHDVLRRQVVAQLVDVAAQGLDVAVLRLGDADRQAVDLAAVLGELDGDLLGEEGARQVGDLERAGDGVVIAQGHEVHAPLAAETVDLARLGEALGRAELAQDPLEALLWTCRSALAVIGVSQVPGPRQADRISEAHGTRRECAVG